MLTSRGVGWGGGGESLKLEESKDLRGVSLSVLIVLAAGNRKARAWKCLSLSKGMGPATKGASYRTRYTQKPSPNRCVSAKPGGFAVRRVV